MSTIPLTQQLAAVLQKLARLASELEMVPFALGETILKKGEPGECAYGRKCTISLSSFAGWPTCTRSVRNRVPAARPCPASVGSRPRR